MTDPAAGKFAILAATRLGGAAIVIVAMTIIGKRWIEPADVIGTGLLAVGAVVVVVLPTLIARRWRGR